MSLRIAEPAAITSLAGVAVHQSWRYWLAQAVVKEAVTFLGHQLVASEEHFDTFRQALRNVFLGRNTPAGVAPPVLLCLRLLILFVLRVLCLLLASATTTLTLWNQAGAWCLQVVLDWWLQYNRSEQSRLTCDKMAAAAAYPRQFCRGFQASTLRRGICGRAWTSARGDPDAYHLRGWRRVELRCDIASCGSHEPVSYGWGRKPIGSKMRQNLDR